MTGEMVVPNRAHVQKLDEEQGGLEDTSGGMERSCVQFGQA